MLCTEPYSGKKEAKHNCNCWIALPVYYFLLGNNVKNVCVLQKNNLHVIVSFFCHMTAGIIRRETLKSCTCPWLHYSNSIFLSSFQLQYFNLNTLLSPRRYLCNDFSSKNLWLFRISRLKVTETGFHEHFKMNYEIRIKDLILQRSPSLAEDSYSLDSTFTLQDRVEAIEQSSEEFYEEVSKRSMMYEDKQVLQDWERTAFWLRFWIKLYINKFHSSWTVLTTVLQK